MPDSLPAWALPFLAAALVSTLLTVALTAFLRRRAILDHPNERSLHVVPTPRGGGWAILAGFAIGCLMLHPGRFAIAAASPLFAGTALLLLISWFDDLKPLPAILRFGVQIAAVALGMTRLHGYVFQGWLPEPLDYAATAFLWLWFVNLFNFMDGMDGLAGSEALVIAFGLFLIAPQHGACMVLAGAVLGFLVWNWSPARIFLGDVGSIPLGYLLGAFLLRTAEDGHWEAALILPLYFLVDATFTLLKRLARRERVWQAHREHFYQYAVQSGRSHRQVAVAILAANILLLIAAVWLAPQHRYLAFDLAGIALIALLAWMKAKPS